MPKTFEKVELRTFDNKGYALTPVEFKDAVPFEVKRMYFVRHFPEGSETGQHCHKIEEEFFIMVQGSSTAIIDRGNGKEEIEFKEGEGMYVPNYVWHGFRPTSEDAVLLALSSTNYSPDRSDYVEDYDEYLAFRDEKLAENKTV